MMRVVREVRFSLGSPGDAPARVTNSWAGWPGSGDLAPHLALRAVVSGPVDPRTGYLVNISLIDRVLREAAIPLLQRARAEPPLPPLGKGGRISRSETTPALLSLRSETAPTHGPAGMMRTLWEATAARLGGIALEELELRATPYLRFAIRSEDLSMVTMTQSFEFAAAHRLYAPELSEDENRKVFGKCTNPSGHGHNYVVEVTVAGRPDAVTGTLTDLPGFEARVKELVIDRFDHKHLNADCAEFARLNPTVENITRVIWDLLERAFTPCRLYAVRVWETPKTYAEYRGEHPPP